MMELEGFGKYLLLEKVATGGMAEVYLAKLTGANGINKFVAIKRILPQYTDNADFVEMFKEEAKIAVNLNHSNIVSIYDFGVEKHRFYLVMEFVEGQNLRQILNHMKKESKDLTIDQVIYIIKEVAAGLDHAHRCLDGTTGRPLNITHRDMSPQNVMISFEGEVKIVDFGIAKAETQMEHTRAGTIKGKFGYMSPEQAEGQSVDPRTDIFSLGIVLWELLAKDRLFTGQNEAATLRKVRDCQIPSLRKINPNIPPELERITMKALAKDKSLRYQTAAAFHKDLNRFLNTQFPEFSTQEFSKIMKSLYHRMYLENRKKLADFAKINASSPVEDKTIVTATASWTESKSVPAKPQGPGGDSKLFDPSTSHVDLGTLKSGDPSRKSKVGVRTQTATGIRHGTQTGIRHGTQVRGNTAISQDSKSNWVWGVLAFIVLVSGLYWKLERRNPNQAQNQNPVLIMPPPALPETTAATNTPGQIDSASSQQQVVPLNIQSSPQGAIVEIDGKNVGITPYIGHIDAHREFHLTIHKDGYLVYDRPTEHASQDIYRIDAALQPEPPMGYITIEIVGGGSDPVVTVNGLRLNDHSQLARYAVPAGVPVKVRAQNPFAQISAEETVTVEQSQRRTVQLILERQGQSN